jgi:long-subunit fatty acid transport protein
LTLRYGWMSGRDLLLVSRVLDTHYDVPAIGVPSNNSTSWQTLFGVDYDDNTVWRYQLLGGVEYRTSASPTIASQTVGIAEAEVTRSPSGLTTLRASATRGVEDAAQTGLSTYIYTSAQLRVDHEYLRNVLVDATATIRQASFSQTGGEQLGVAFGTGASWLINRTLRLSLTYDFADVRNAHLPAGTVAGDYMRSLTLLTLRVGL